MRTNLFKITRMAILAVAMVFTFSCTEDKDDDGNPSGGGNAVYGPSLPYEGKTYKTVKIGTQTWLAENLNYNVSGSQCYNNQESNCAIYGRLYYWATAMNLPSSCNSSTCSSQIKSKHQGICPSGYHIPSDADWNVLMKFVDPSCLDNSTCTGAGTKLKSSDLWNAYSGVPAGTDEYGFSALPGGFGYGATSLGKVGDYGVWWSATEIDTEASDWFMYYRNEDVVYGSSGKFYSRSVRCLNSDWP